MELVPFWYLEVGVKDLRLGKVGWWHQDLPRPSTWTASPSSAVAALEAELVDEVFWWPW